MRNVKTLTKIQGVVRIPLSEEFKRERARSPGPDKIQAGDLVTVKKALELVRNGAGRKFFNLKSPLWPSLWHSSTNKNLAFEARPCYGDCCPENGFPVGVMLAVGYGISSRNSAEKKLIRICPLCGSLREEEIKRKPKNNQPNQGGNHEGGDNTKE